MQERKEGKELVKNNSAFEKVIFFNKCILEIMSYLTAENSTLGQVNKNLYSLARFQSIHGRELLFHSIYNRRITSTTTAMLLLLSQYKVERERKYHPIRAKLFDKIDNKHINRVSNMKKFIRIYGKEALTNTDFIAVIKIITSLDCPDLEIHETVPMHFKPHMGYDDFFSCLPLRDAIDIIFIYYLAREIQYAHKNKSLKYRETLFNIMNLFWMRIKKSEFLHVFDSFVDLAKNKIKSYKHTAKYWNRCLVWQGYNGFVQFENLTEKEANAYYTSVGEGADPVLEVAIPEQPFKIKYIFPFREREKLLTRFIQTIDDFVAQNSLRSISDESKNNSLLARRL